MLLPTSAAADTRQCRSAQHTGPAPARSTPAQDPPVPGRCVRQSPPLAPSRLGPMPHGLSEIVDLAVPLGLLEEGGVIDGDQQPHHGTPLSSG